MYKLWPGQAQYMTILTLVALTFNLPEKNISNGTSPARTKIVTTLSRLPASGPDKSDIFFLTVVLVYVLRFE